MPKTTAGTTQTQKPLGPIVPQRLSPGLFSLLVRFVGLGFRPCSALWRVEVSCFGVLHRNPEPRPETKL